MDMMDPGGRPISKQNITNAIETSLMASIVKAASKCVQRGCKYLTAKYSSRLRNVILVNVRSNDPASGRSYPMDCSGTLQEKNRQ